MIDKIREALEEIAEYPSLDAEELQRIARAGLVASVAHDPVAWVRVIDGEPMKYSWFGSKRLPVGKHWLYTTPPTTDESDTVKIPHKLLNELHSSVNEYDTLLRVSDHASSVNKEELLTERRVLNAVRAILDWGNMHD